MAETRFQAQIKETVAGEATAVVRETATEMRFRSHSSYADLNMLEKADFLRFNGDNIGDWLFQIEQFFLIDRTPEELKVSLASLYFDDIAAIWHQSIVQSVFWKHVRHDWVNYKMLLQGKSNKLVEDSIAKLKLLQETEGIEMYHSRFESICTRVKLDEDFLVSLYLIGLKTDTQVNIRMFQPHTIQQCFLIGKLYERAHPLKRESELKAEVDKEVVEIVIKTEVDTTSETRVISRHESDDDQTSEAGKTDSSNHVESIQQLEWRVCAEKMDIETMDSVLEPHCVQHTNLISQHQVPISSLEHSLNFCKPTLDVIEYHAIGRTYQAQSHSNFGDVNSNTCQVFDTMLLRRQVLSKGHKKNFPKTWKFKFKGKQSSLKVPSDSVQIHAAMIVGKEALNVDITTANKQLEYTRECRREKEYEFEQVTNHTPFSVDKLVRLKDHDALLINQFLLSDERFQLKHKWRSKLLHSVSELMFCLDSLYTRESSIERYEDFIWEQNDKGTKLLCIRRLVVYKLGDLRHKRL